MPVLARSATCRGTLADMSTPEIIASPIPLRRSSRTEYPDSLDTSSSPALIDRMSAPKSSTRCFALSTVFPCHPSVDVDESSKTRPAASERGKSRSEILIS
ncbi:unnamed protein product [Tuber melanosporum]|uniref:(Perigord truffle) hypothetical protein n=1 Tax=Tuber melanosporum (strain Mel28) TaxID=656061 RepID=D5GFD2_TUBMM|nr:uncharacterized protein GSTUM_00006838001 [Tuber melanosporum]CAZ83225.1 unnamed protein product [Tuber melanosporum]